MSEINIDALKEITFSRLKNENFDNFLDEKNKDANIKQYKSLESSHVVLKTDVESSLQFISALNQLAVLADNMAEGRSSKGTTTEQALLELLERSMREEDSDENEAGYQEGYNDGEDEELGEDERHSGDDDEEEGNESWR